MTEPVLKKQTLGTSEPGSRVAVSFSVFRSQREVGWQAVQSKKRSTEKQWPDRIFSGLEII